MANTGYCILCRILALYVRLTFCCVFFQRYFLLDKGILKYGKNGPDVSFLTHTFTYAHTLTLILTVVYWPYVKHTFWLALSVSLLAVRMIKGQMSFPAHPSTHITHSHIPSFSLSLSLSQTRTHKNTSKIFVTQVNNCSLQIFMYTWVELQYINSVCVFPCES